MATTIEEELKRIQVAKIDLRSAIESKAVKVDPNATIDKYPDFVKSIGDITLEDKTITINDTYEAPEGKGWNKVIVNVPGGGSANLQTLNVTNNGTYTPTAPVDGYNEVNVNVQPNLTTLNATQNTTYTPTAPVQGFSSVTVNVPAPAINLQNKNVTTDGTYTADAGYDGLGTVTVNVSGSNESSVTMYYTINNDTFYSEFYTLGTNPSDDYRLWFNQNGFSNNIDKMYIDGVLQQNVVTYHKFDLGTHTVKVVLKANANSIPDDTFRYVAGLRYVDLSKYTGTTLGFFNISNNNGNGFYILPENCTLNGLDNGNYYLPANSGFGVSTSFNYDSLYIDSNNQNYSSDSEGRYIIDDNNNKLLFINGKCRIPEGVDEVPVGAIKTYARGYMLPKTLDKFHGFGYGNGTPCFFGSCPTTLDLANGMNDCDSHIFVPASDVASYRAAFTSAGYTNAPNNVLGFSTATGTFTYASGDKGFYIYRWANFDTERFYLVMIYDSNGHLMVEVSPTERDHLYIPASLLTSGYGTYTVQWVWGNQPNNSWESPIESLFVHSDAISTLDLMNIEDTTLGTNMVRDLANLEELTVSPNITEIKGGFCASCPKLSKVYINAGSPPTIDGSSSENFENSNGGQPIDVLVPDASLYQADSEWANLESRGLITLTNM